MTLPKLIWAGPLAIKLATELDARGRGNETIVVNLWGAPCHSLCHACGCCDYDDVCAGHCSAGQPENCQNYGHCSDEILRAEVERVRLAILGGGA